MKSIYDFPHLYDAILRSCNEQIARETKSIDKLITMLELNNPSILDVACGTCAHDILLAKKGYDVTGIDISQNMLKMAAEHAKEASVSLELFKKDIIDFEIEKKGYSCAIFMSETFPLLTKMEDIQSHLNCVKKHLTEGGIYIIDIDKQNGTIRDKRVVWGKKSYNICGTIVDVWFEDLPGNSENNVNQLNLHCQIWGEEVISTIDHWKVLAYTPEDYAKLFSSLTDWHFVGFHNWENLSSDISDCRHFFAVLRKK